MSNVKTWSTTAGSNNSAAPNGAPESMAPSGVNDTIRENMAAIARWFGDTNGSLTSTGSSNAYVLTSNSSLSAYADGDTLMFEANHANTGAATLNVDSVGAQSLVDSSGAALAGGEIVSGGRYLVSYDLANTNWMLIGALGVTPVSSGGTGATDASTARTNLGVTDEFVEDLAGAMFSGNTETGGTLTYQDGDGTVDFALNTSGLSAMTASPIGTDEFLYNDGGTMKTMSYNEVALPSTNDSNARTFADTDVGEIVYYTGTGGHSFTMNSGTGQDDCWIIVVNSGSGNLTLASGTATINSANSLLTLPAGGIACLIRESSTVWFAGGSLQ